MLSIKKYFFFASLAFAAQALAAPAAENTASTAASTTPAMASTKAPPATVRQADKAADPAGQLLADRPSSWSMLLVGAGVLLLPRKRRVDNSVR
ncbi:hypothetical protein GCM10007387_27730 [Pseudoduganella albidiflava]|uniref:PEP-CTERM sorting domain-containing protein n=2 Tax=Pseudoduganella albidiflava TaxID=321983 RepID=A0AA87XXI0_9BURK|nr:hypothetical protein GCM10007387_27730 [Pseudoduganella albidiflava]